jgi:hypothetical protein
LGFLIVLLVLPAMLRWLALVRDALPRFDIRALSCLAMLLLGPVVGLFAMVTNGEMKDTDFPLLIIFGIFMLWGRPDHPAFIYSRKSTIWTSATMLRLYASLLFGFASSELYMGYARERVAFAEHLFFERNDSDQNPGIAYFQHMRSSHQMRDVVSQMTEVIHSSAQPIFLGPSLEFGYAAFHLPPTMHLPVWWWPGSAYGPADEPLLLDQWKRNKYATAIFFRKGGSYMPPGMMPMVQDSYTKDDRWPELIVYRLPQADRH